jgi:hypothetical protein
MLKPFPLRPWHIAATFMWRQLMATTLEAIQAKMKKLQGRVDALIAKKAQAAVDQIRALMLKHGLTTEDIEAEAKTKREAKVANGTVSNVKAKATSSLKGEPRRNFWATDRRATIATRGLLIVQAAYAFRSQ